MGTFSAKMVYKRVRGWTSGQSLPVLKSVKYPPPPPPPGTELTYVTETVKDSLVTGPV